MNQKFFDGGPVDEVMLHLLTALQKKFGQIQTVAPKDRIEKRGGKQIRIIGKSDDMNCDLLFLFLIMKMVGHHSKICMSSC